MLKNIGIALRTSAAIILVCCVIYQLAVTGIARVVMPYQAGGSLLYNENNQVMGSVLIGQNFTDPDYFQARISSIDYDANGSGSPNYAPSNPALTQRIEQSLTSWQQNNPQVSVSSVPVDLITNSGSGLDPDITPEAALVQVPRISNLTGIPMEQLESLINRIMTKPQLGILGEPAINVLQLNLELQQLKTEAR